MNRHIDKAALAEADEELDQLEEFVRIESRKPLRERAPEGSNSN